MHALTLQKRKTDNNGTTPHLTMSDSAFTSKTRQNAEVSTKLSLDWCTNLARKNENGTSMDADMARELFNDSNMAPGGDESSVYASETLASAANHVCTDALTILPLKVSPEVPQAPSTAHLKQTSPPVIAIALATPGSVATKTPATGSMRTLTPAKRHADDDGDNAASPVNAKLSKNENGEESSEWVCRICNKSDTSVTKYLKKGYSHFNILKSGDSMRDAILQHSSKEEHMPPWQTVCHHFLKGNTLTYDDNKILACYLLKESREYFPYSGFETDVSWPPLDVLELQNYVCYRVGHCHSLLFRNSHVTRAVEKSDYTFDDRENVVVVMKQIRDGLVRGMTQNFNKIKESKQSDVFWFIQQVFVGSSNETSIVYQDNDTSAGEAHSPPHAQILTDPLPLDSFEILGDSGALFAEALEESRSTPYTPHKLELRGPNPFAE